MQADLAPGSRIFGGLPPGAGGKNGESMAAGGQGRHGELGVGQSTGFVVIELNHQMGTEAQLPPIHQGPVVHTQLQGPGTGGQERFSGGRQDLNSRLSRRQGLLQLLNSQWWRNFLQGGSDGGHQGVGWAHGLACIAARQTQGFAAADTAR